MNEPLGIVAERRAIRDAVLLTARVSASARARIMGRRPYLPPTIRTHTITVNCAKPEERKVETVDRAPPPPKPEREPRLKKRLGLGPRSTGTVRARQVIAAFCKAFNVDMDDVLSIGRSRRFARPRQAAMYFLNVEMKLTMTPVGKMLERDHTTILHGRRVVSDLLERDVEFSARYHRAVRAIRAMWAE